MSRPLPAARPVRSPERDPDLRAIFAGRRMLVVRWGQYLDRDLSRGDGAGRIVFDLWVTDDAVLARQHGAAEAGRAIRRLTRLARELGRSLRLGVPLGPRGASAGRELRFPRVAVAEPPAFRFTYSRRASDHARLRVVPWGFTADGLDLREPWRGVVGEIRALDDDRAVARFAHADPVYADGARSALRRWAERDGWQLEIEAGLSPIGDPADPPPTHGGSAECRRCERRLSTGFASHLGFATRGWEPTRCGVCGGRMRWWSAA